MPVRALRLSNNHPWAKDENTLKTMNAREGIKTNYLLHQAFDSMVKNNECP